MRADRRSRRVAGAQRSHSMGRTPSVPTPEIDPGSRLAGLFVLFAVVALLIVVRMVQLALIDGPARAQESRDDRLQSIVLPARRGTIYDRNGKVLATSITAATIQCTPYEVTDAQGEAAQLAAILDGDRDEYFAKLSNKEKSNDYIAHKVDAELGDQVRALNLPGIYVVDDSKRVYPQGRIAGQVVGMCDPDDQGISGLEAQYNDILAGEDGLVEIERGAGAEGLPIAGGVHSRTEARNGSDIVVSLDLDMQEYVEARLLKAVEDVGGSRGSAILYDGGTGQIVAIASTPLLDPSNRDYIEEGSDTISPITVAFEPGSIFKTVSAAAILEEGALAPTDMLNCPAQLQADEYIITDAHERWDTILSFDQILTQSSNVGMALATERLGFGPLYQHIKRYGFTDVTGVDYPGESAGYSTDASQWSKVQSYNVSFGQGISVTPLQVVRFYGALANDGMACTPHFLLSEARQADGIDENGLYDDSLWPKEQIVQNVQAIEPLVNMLRNVVDHGTGIDAKIDGFEPAGKTGTAEYTEDGVNYELGSYNISFVGFLPGTDSQLVCFVGVTEVPGDYVTTPAFKDIMAYAINHYGISMQ